MTHSEIDPYDIHFLFELKDEKKLAKLMNLRRSKVFDEPPESMTYSFASSKEGQYPAENIEIALWHKDNLKAVDVKEYNQDNPWGTQAYFTTGHKRTKSGDNYSDSGNTPDLITLRKIEPANMLKHYHEDEFNVNGADIYISKITFPKRKCSYIEIFHVNAGLGGNYKNTDPHKEAEEEFSKKFFQVKYPSGQKPDLLGYIECMYAFNAYLENTGQKTDYEARQEKYEHDNHVKTLAFIESALEAGAIAPMRDMPSQTLLRNQPHP